jgi:hypothetical protein
MAPHTIQYVLAHGEKIAAIGGGLVLGTVVALACEAFSLWAVVATLTALPLGSIAGMVLIWPVILTVGAFLNGAPFHAGDMVHILVGPHRDRMVRIYDVWGPRSQVRVELGEQEKKEVTDVFWNIEVCRQHQRRSIT